MFFPRAFFVFLLFLMISGSGLMTSGPAHAACTGPAGKEGDMFYARNYKTMVFCNGDDWVNMGYVPGAAQTGEESGGGGGTSDWSGNLTFTPASIGPTGCSSVGDVCADGSIFAGDTNLYVTDVNQSTSIGWSTVNQTNSGAQSDTNGAANQAWIAANRTLSQYPAFELCENLDRHGYTDWYLPARNELHDVLYPNRNAIGGFTTGDYWSSTESEDDRARVVDFNDGDDLTGNKGNNKDVRCVRRDSGGGGSSPATIQDADANGTLGPFLSVGQSFTVSGSASNNGSYTVDALPDNDTIEVSETLTSEGPAAATITISTGGGTEPACPDPLSGLGSPATYAPGTTGGSMEPATDAATFHTRVTFTGSPSGVIFESGAGGQGMALWVDSGNLYFGAGDGATTATNNDGVILSVPVTDYLNTTVDIVAAVDPSTGEAALYINDCWQGSDAATGGGLQNGEWAGTNSRGYGQIGDGVRAGAPGTGFSGGTLESDLSFYSGQLPADFPDDNSSGGGGGAGCTPGIQSFAQDSQNGDAESYTLTGFDVTDTGNDQILVVVTGTESSSGNVPTGATFDGQAMTELDLATGSNAKAAVYTLANPPAVTGDIAVSYGGGTSFRGAVGAYLLDCVDTGASPQTAKSEIDAASVTTSVTPSEDNSIIVDVLYDVNGNTDPAETGDADTEQVAGPVGGNTNSSWGSASLVQGPAGQADFSWTMDSGASAHIVAVFPPQADSGGGGGGDGSGTDVTNGLVAHWTLDETGGSAIADSAGSYGGTWSDGSGNDTAGESESGQVGTALNFDGSDDHIDIPNSFGLFDGTSAFSLSLWAKPDSLPSSDDWQNAPMLINFRGENSFFMTLADGSSTPDRVGARGNYSGSGWTTVVESNPLTVGDWVHLVVTYDPASGYTLYENGSSLDTSSMTETINVDNSQNNIGADDDSGTDRFFDGALDDIRIYDRVLSPSEVSTLHAYDGSSGGGGGSGGGSGSGDGPAACPDIGDYCPDGTIYAGDTDLFVADVNQSTGTQWSTEDVNTGADSETDGAANQQWIVDNETLSQYPAFELCENLDRHGHTDWYLPARNELRDVLWPNRSAIGGFTTGRYWSSTEDVSWLARVVYFSSGSSPSNFKDFIGAVRCVRRGAPGNGTGGGTGCTGPAGVEGDMFYAGNYNTMVFCNGTDWIDMGQISGGGGTGCTGPAGDPGDMFYASNHKTMVFCNGTDWIDMAVPGDGVLPPADATDPVWSTAAGTVATINTGDALSTTVTATDDSGSVSYSKQSGAGWISVNSSTGELTGSTSTANTYSITVRAEDPSGNFVDRTFDVVVQDPGPGTCPPTPSDPGDIGCVMPGGEIFAGDGNMYVTDADQGTAQWSSEYVNTGADSNSDGASNQQWIVSNETLSEYPAFDICANLNRHGHADWYLPALDELGIIISNRGAIAGFEGNNDYWSSTEGAPEDEQANLYQDFFGSYNQDDDRKDHVGNHVRCVRRPDTTDPVWSTAAGTVATINTGDALSTTVTATDDSGSVSYSKQSGAGWISVNSSTGALTGTAPGSPETASITVRAQDASGNFTDRTFDVVVESSGGASCSMAGYTDQSFNTNYTASGDGFIMMAGSCSNSGYIDAIVDGSIRARNLLYVSPSFFAMTVPVKDGASYEVDTTCSSPSGGTKWFSMGCSSGVFGDYVGNSFNTDYTAATDGFVTISGTCGTGGYIEGQVNGNRVTRTLAYMSPSHYTQTFPVKAGDDWRAEATCGSPSGVVLWTPMDCPSNGLGSYEARTFGTNYTAATDGFVVASGTCGTTGWMEGSVNGTVVADNTVYMSPSEFPMTFPVKAGDDWSVSGANGCSPSGQVQWVPFGGCSGGSADSTDPV